MEIRRNILLFKLYQLFASMWPLSVLAVVFFQQITGSYTFALGVFAIANITQGITEIPTGIISDKIGRKKTMILSSVIMIISSVIIALAGTFSHKYLLVFGAMIQAVSEAFASGTDDALMYETMEELHKSDKYDVIYAHSQTFGQIGLGVGALVATVITFFYSLTTLAWVTAIIDIVPIIICFQFVEPKKHTVEECSSVKHFMVAIKAFIKNKKLRILAIIEMLNRGIRLTGHKFEGAYFNMLIPTWAVNITRIIKQTCSAISFAITPYFRKFGFYRVLVTSTIGVTIIKTFAVILNNLVTPFIQSCVTIFQGPSSTAESTLLQKELSPKQRATMGSIVALLGGILLAVICWIIGIIADTSSVWVAMVALILCNVFISIGYYWMLKRYKQ